MKLGPTVLFRFSLVRAGSADISPIISYPASGLRPHCREAPVKALRLRSTAVRRDAALTEPSQPWRNESVMKRGTK